MPKEIERRILCTEVRVDAAEGEKTKIRGYAAVFNQLSEDLGGFREQISVGAFAQAITTSDVRALFNHDNNFVLGRSAAGTLVMREDQQGLYVEIDPPDTQAARDLITSMKRGDVNQMSFAFRVEKGDQVWEKKGENDWLRTINKVSRLYDVSVVAYPAYPQSTANVRDFDDARKAAELVIQQAKEQDAVRAARGREIEILEKSI